MITFQTNRINSSNAAQKPRNISFKSKKIYDLEIFKLNKKGEYELVPAMFTRLINSSEEDNKALSAIKKSWKNCDFLNELVEKFSFAKNPYAHFAVEIKDDKLPLSKRIVSLCCTSRPELLTNDELKIYLLQGKPMYKHGSSQRQYKGGGELMMYGLTKIAKATNVDKLSLDSTNDAFYDAIHMRKKLTNLNRAVRYSPDEEARKSGMVTSERYLFAEDFNSFIQKVVEKYKLF